MSKRKTPTRVRAVLDRRSSSAAGSHTSQRVRGQEERVAIRDQEMYPHGPCWTCGKHGGKGRPTPYEGRIVMKMQCDSCYDASAQEV